MQIPAQSSNVFSADFWGDWIICFAAEHDFGPLLSSANHIPYFAAKKKQMWIMHKYYRGQKMAKCRYTVELCIWCVGVYNTDTTQHWQAQGCMYRKVAVPVTTLWPHRDPTGYPLPLSRASSQLTRSFFLLVSFDLDLLVILGFFAAVTLQKSAKTVN